MNFELLKEFPGFHNNQTENITDCLDSGYGWKQYVLFIKIMTYTILVVGVAANIMAVCSVFGFKALRKPTYFVIASLSVADIFCLTIHAIVRMYPSLRHVFSLYLMIFLATCFMTISTNHVIALSIIRVVAVCKPLQYNRSMTKRRKIGCILVLCWGFGLIAGVISVQVVFSLKSNPYTFVFTILRDVAIPQTIFLISHVVKICTLKRASMFNSRTSHQIRFLSKCACAIVTLNIVTMLPTWVGFLVLLINKDMDVDIRITCYFIPLAATLHALHYSLNPFIFFFLSKPYQIIRGKPSISSTNGTVISHSAHERCSSALDNELPLRSRRHGSLSEED